MLTKTQLATRPSEVHMVQDRGSRQYIELLKGQIKQQY